MHRSTTGLLRGAVALHQVRCYASQVSGNANTLLFLEHKAGKLNPATLNAVTAAKALGGKVTGILIGPDSDQVVDTAKKYVFLGLAPCSWKADQRPICIKGCR